MFLNKKDKIKSSAKKVDKLVTWLIIWWVVASLIGASKTNKWQEILKNIKTEAKKIKEENQWFFNKIHSVFWKVTVRILKIFSRK
jgi:hypothetical protein